MYTGVTLLHQAASKAAAVPCCFRQAVCKWWQAGQPSYKISASPSRVEARRNDNKNKNTRGGIPPNSKQTLPETDRHFLDILLSIHSGTAKG